MASRNMLLPMWHGVCFDYRECITDVIKNFHLDHGEAGIDIVNTELHNEMLFVRYAKHVKCQCCHQIVHSAKLLKAAHPVSSQFEKLSEIFKEDILILNRILKWQKINSFKKKIIRNPHKHQRPSTRVVEETRNIYGYKKALRAAKKIQEKEKWFKRGDCLDSCKNPHDNECFVFRVGGEKMNKLVGNIVKESLDENEFEDSTLWSFPRQVHQVICEVTQNSVFCGIRQRKCCSLLKCEATLGSIQMVDEFSSENPITDFDISPYIPGEVIYTSETGNVHIRKANSRQFSVNLNLAEHISSPPSRFCYKCKFSSHPRCLIGVSNKNVLMYDIRSSANRVKELISLPLVYLPRNEKIHNVLSYFHNDHWKFIVTTHSLLLVDERFCKQPVLKWSHMINCLPTLGSVTRNHNSENCVLLGSSSSQDSSLIHLTHDNLNNMNIYSQCPTMRISKPSDSMETMLSQGHYKVQNFMKRIASPFIGLCILPSSSSSDQMVILQLTQAGDLFSQAVQMNFNDENHQLQMLNITRDDDNTQNLRELEKWNHICSAPNKNPVYSSNCHRQKNLRRANKMMKALTKEQKCSNGCCFCNKQKNFTTELTSEEFCPSCGINTETSRRLKKVFEMGGVITDSSLNKPLSLTNFDDFGLEEINWAKYTDWVSQNIRKTWIRKDNSIVEYGEFCNVAEANAENDNLFSFESFHDNFSKQNMAGSMSFIRADITQEDNIIPSSQTISSPVSTLVKKVVAKKALNKQINIGF